MVATAHPSIAIIDRPIGGGGCEGCSSLKSVLKNQVASGKELYLGTLAWQSLTDQQRADFDLSNKPDRTPEEDARLAAAKAAYDAAIEKFTPKAEAVWGDHSDRSLHRGQSEPLFVQAAVHV